MTLVLASSSPRRQELLRNAGIDFLAQPANVPEVCQPGESPIDYAQRLAREKAKAIWSACKTEVARHSPTARADDRRRACPERSEGTGDLFVLGADTIVVVDDHILEKPAGVADAARMLRLLSGRTHQVTTGVCLVGEGFEDLRSATTDVTFDTLTEADISAYVAHGEPMDKAGAYAIQGIASRWIWRLEGCYFNVMGLPVPLVYRMLRQHGAI